MSEENPPDPVLVKLGELLAIIRAGRPDNMSIPELAAAVEVDVKTIRTFENGRSWPQDKNRRQIEGVLGLRPGWLVDAREAIGAGKSIPSPFAHSLGHWLNRYAGGPHLGHATDETLWESVKIRLGQQCQDLNVLGGIWPTTHLPQPDPTTPADPAPRYESDPLTQISSLPNLYGMTALEAFAQLGNIAPLARPQSITQPLQSLPQMTGMMGMMGSTSITAQPGVRATETAAQHQLLAERDRLIGSMMEVVRETVSRATHISTQIVNNAEQSRRQQTTAILAAISNLNGILAELHALAASSEPGPLAFELRTLHDRAFATVNALASSCEAPPAGGELTNAERVELAAELAAQFTAAAQQRGQEMSRGDAFNLALTAIRDMPATKDGLQDRVAEILKDPTSHGLNIQEHLDRWSTDHRSATGTAAQGHVNAFDFNTPPNRESIPPRLQDAEPSPPDPETDE